MRTAGYAKAQGREQDPLVEPSPHSHHDPDAVRVSHPAFGMVKASRVSGQGNLFGVDWPQQHYVTLTISTAVMDRNLSRDWTHAQQQVIEIALSEVQWAQMLTGMNTEGVQCTIERLAVPRGMPVGMIPSLPPHLSDAENHKAEVQAAADRAMEKTREAEAMLHTLMAGTGSITKTKLAEVLSVLRAGNREATDTLPFVADSAREAIAENVVRAKSEVSAFISHATNQLGERAVGAMLAYEASQGRDPQAALMDALAPAREVAQDEATEPRG